MERTLRIFAKERKTKNGAKFMTYSYTKDGKRFLNVKFGGTNVPSIKETGYYTIVVEDSKLNIKHASLKAIETGLQSGYVPSDTLWVTDLISISRDKKYEEELALRKMMELNEIL